MRYRHETWFLSFLLCLLLAVAALAAPSVARADPVPRCQDKTVQVLRAAGFTGQSLRIAWAVVMRESRGQNLQPGHPQFNGADYGIWQINAPTWSRSPWWSYQAMTTPAVQSRIAYRILTQRGTYWRPWGLTRDGRAMDTSHYGSWSSSQQWVWIWAPYWQFYKAFPC